MAPAVMTISKYQTFWQKKKNNKYKKQTVVLLFFVSAEIMVPDLVASPLPL